MDPVLWVFVAVYVGMLLGGVPGWRIDRTGIALLGATAMVALGGLSLPAAWAAIDVGTLGLLLGLMLLSAQFRLGGFYTRATRQLVARPLSPPRLLLALMLLAGLLSALLTNDVVCVSMAPVLVDVCRRRGLDPVPFLLGLAAASNIGSAATLIGNPQNLLIGEALHLSFARYLLVGAPPALLGLGIAWAILARAHAGRFERATTGAGAVEQTFDRGQTMKGAALLLLLVAGLLLAPADRALLALLAGCAVLVSRRYPTPAILQFVDWPLLLLFAGLFVVHGAVQQAGHPTAWLAAAADTGVDLRAEPVLFLTALVASNVVSNVPAVMLLLPAADAPGAGELLALVSTLAGNLLLVGSIANIIVFDQAARLGVEPAGSTWFRAHLRTGVPITLATLAVAAGWLWLCGQLGLHAGG